MKQIKTIFSAIGTIEIEGQKKRLRLNSPDHWQHYINQLFEGKKYGISVSEYKASRSKSQLAYYWVILGYLGDYTGYTPEELHDAIMRQKFGVKHVSLGGIEQDVRKSIADSARFPTSDMVELIHEVLQIAHKLGVIIPSKEELGYL